MPSVKRKRANVHTDRSNATGLDGVELVKIIYEVGEDAKRYLVTCKLGHQRYHIMVPRVQWDAFDMARRRYWLSRAQHMAEMNLTPP